MTRFQPSHRSRQRLARWEARKIIPVYQALGDGDLIAVQHAARAIEPLAKSNRRSARSEACDARMKSIRPPGTSPVVVDPEKDQAMFVGFSTKPSRALDEVETF